ncbi:hypothetical protein VULLAG_LOCUS6450 [Vulpes lagopus]
MVPSFCAPSMWNMWSSKKMWGLIFTKMGPLGAPARKRASSISRPQRRRVFSTRAPELAALLAVTRHRKGGLKGNDLFKITHQMSSDDLGFGACDSILLTFHGLREDRLEGTWSVAMDVWKEGRSPLLCVWQWKGNHTLSLTFVQTESSVSGQPTLLTYTLWTSTFSC